MRGLRKFAAWVLGGVFFIAGILKMMDPVGTGLIVEEYYKFFGLGFLMFSAKFVGMGLALLETVLGAAVITGVWRRVTASVALAVLAGFTVITAILWIANPAMDCGCFGEAIHLTHAQSFIKNIILLAFWALAYLPFIKMLPADRIKYVSFAIGSISAILFMFWSLGGIPAMDFTPFKPGTELDGGPVLSFCDGAYDYHDELAMEGNVIVFSAYDPDRLGKQQKADIYSCMEEANYAGYTTLFLLGCGPDGFDDATAFFADRRTLMTLNRSNGGAMFISDGQIVCKWPNRSLPSQDKLAALAVTDTTESVIKENSPQQNKLQAFLLYCFAVLLLL